MIDALHLNLHVCPLSDQFNQMCPSGRGFIPNGDLLYGVPTADSYKSKTKLLLHDLTLYLNHTAESLSRLNLDFGTSFCPVYKYEKKSDCLNYSSTD